MGIIFDVIGLVSNGELIYIKIDCLILDCYYLNGFEYISK